MAFNRLTRGLNQLSQAFGSRVGGAGVPPADLISFNPLGGASSRIRPAKRGTPAVNVRGTVTTAPGRLGPCASFDGSSALAVGAGAAGSGLNLPLFTGDWTIAVDFRFTTLPSIGSRATLLAMNRVDTLQQWELALYAGSGPQYYLVFNWFLTAGGIGNRSVYNYPASPNYATNTWYTACVRYTASGSGYTIDANGQTSSTVRNTVTGNPDTTGPICFDANNLNTVTVGSLWDQTNGWRFGFIGRLENLRSYDRRLTDTEVTTISAGNDPFNPPSTTTMVVADPQPYQVAKKDGSGQGSMRVTGYLRGDALTPTDIQWSWNGSAWADMSATIDSTARTFDGTITLIPAGSNPSDRQGTLQLRCKNSTGIASSVAGVGVGYVFGVWGQSNACGAYTNPQPYSASNGLSGGVYDFSYTGRLLEENAAIHNLHATGAYAWVYGSSEAHEPGSQWPRFAALWTDRTGWPTMIVPAAVAGSSINGLSSSIGGWNPTLSPIGRNRLVNNYNTAKNRCLYVGGVTAMLGQQGEQDASTAMSAAIYQGHIETLTNAINTDLSCKTLNSTLPSGYSGATAINTGIAAAAAANANFLVGPDLSGIPYDNSPHWTTDANAIAIAAAWDARLNVLGY